jgi:hypothetical protein
MMRHQMTSNMNLIRICYIYFVWNLIVAIFFSKTISFGGYFQNMKAINNQSINNYS